MNSLDAEMAGCSTLLGSLKKGVDKSLNVLLSWSPTFLCTLHFSLECSARGLVVTELHTPVLTCGCLAARVSVALWSGWCVAEGRMFALSNDIEHAVATAIFWLIVILMRWKRDGWIVVGSNTALITLR